MPIPPPADIQPGTVDQEAGVPAPLPQELRIARPLAVEGPIRVQTTVEPIDTPEVDYHLSIEVGP